MIPRDLHSFTNLDYGENTDPMFYICKTKTLIDASFRSVNAKAKVDPAGTWSYTANEAPYEYSAGNIVVSKDGKEYKVELVLGEHYKIKAVLPEETESDRQSIVHFT